MAADFDSEVRKAGTKIAGTVSATVEAGTVTGVSRVDRVVTSPLPPIVVV